MTYTTTAQDAKAIRHDIKKALGHNSKAVAVRSHNYSMGSSIYVSIKTAAAVADLAAIKEIASRQQTVRRCHLTGDILSGGNQFVTVDIAESAKSELVTADFLAAVTRAVEAIRTGRVMSEKISHNVILRGNAMDSDLDILKISADGVGTRVANIYGDCNAQYVAERLAVIIATAGK